MGGQCCRQLEKRLFASQLPAYSRHTRLLAAPELVRGRVAVRGGRRACMVLTHAREVVAEIRKFLELERSPENFPKLASSAADSLKFLCFSASFGGICL